MFELSMISQISLYVLLVLIGVLTLIIGWAQIGVLKGRAFKNPDGTVDDWHEQKIFYGISLADVFLACPAGIAGVILVFLTPRWGFYLLALVSFWLLWANTMTTATSLRFEKPRITLTWLIVYPFGAVVGLAYIVWSIVHFETIFAPGAVP
ncbi:MAG: hypothetical protein GY856_26540 [bacterium]|nr:hypothetical protein [bacterium]